MGLFAFRPTGCAFVCLALVACAGGDGASNKGSAHSTSLPLLVGVSAGPVTSGFAAGRLRKRADLHAFRITKYPVTRAEYARCVSAGACKKVDKPACDLGETGPLARFSVEEPLSPALCVGVEQAKKFCAWGGGRLPTLAEWFLAARGSEPKLYSWGNEAPSCDRHPRVERIEPAGPEDQDALVRTAPCAMVEANGRLVVAEHEAGASPYGVQDILLAPGELLATDAKALFSGCLQGFDACLVTGDKPGAIEAVAPLRAKDKASDAQTDGNQAYGFRCVLGEK
jgi:hypothetical protein